MAYIEDLTFTNAASIGDNDIVYLGKLGDIDPDRRTSVAELIARVGSGLKVSQGSFTPALTTSGGSPTVTYGTRIGAWSRAGNLIHVQIVVSTAALSGGSGELRISGLPFIPISDVVLASRFGNVTWAAGRTPFAVIGSGASYVRLLTMGSGTGEAGIPPANWTPSGGSVILTGTYITP